jgi:hypothetical protein
MRQPLVFLTIALLPFLTPATQAAGSDDQTLIQELRQLADEARRQRAADRWLQRALDDLVARHEWPWQRELVFDDFADGDYQHNPTWQAVSGRFWVARGRGLRSRADTRPSSRQDDGSPQPSVEAAILGALLDQAISRRDDGRPPSGLAVYDEPSELLLQTEITNAFALDAEFSLETPDGPGRLALSLLQGSSSSYGYRLRIKTGRDGFVELERVRGGRTAIVDGARLTTDPGDGGRHRLAWRQAANGDVTVELDDRPLFRVRDKAFRDGYQQLVLSHWSGDLTLHSIRVSGTN